MCCHMGLLVYINMVFCELTRFIVTPMSLIVDYNNNDDYNVLFMSYFSKLGHIAHYKAKNEISRYRSGIYSATLNGSLSRLSLSFFTVISIGISLVFWEVTRFIVTRVFLVFDCNK